MFVSLQTIIFCSYNLHLRKRFGAAVEYCYESISFQYGDKVLSPEMYALAGVTALADNLILSSQSVVWVAFETIQTLLVKCRCSYVYFCSWMVCLVTNLRFTVLVN